MDNNCYILGSGSQGLLIDAANEADAILDLAKEAGVTITSVVTTHRHADHVQALQQVLDATGAKHYASSLDAPALPAEVDVELSDGDSIGFAGHWLPVRVLRGHTPGGLAIAAEIEGKTHLFVGDSLFPGGVGKTNNPGEFDRLLGDVEKRLFANFPDDAMVHPGHGKSTTLGAERPHLDEWRERGW